MMFVMTGDVCGDDLWNIEAACVAAEAYIPVQYVQQFVSTGPWGAMTGTDRVNQLTTVFATDGDQTIYKKCHSLFFDN